MKPLKYAHFHTPPWAYDVVVAQGTREQANQLILNITGDSNIIGDQCQGLCYTSEGFPIVVWVPSVLHVTVLVHELMHAIFHILRYRGLALGPDSEETYTYTLQDLLDRVLTQKKWMTLK